MHASRRGRWRGGRGGACLRRRPRSRTAARAGRSLPLRSHENPVSISSRSQLSSEADSRVMVSLSARILRGKDTPTGKGSPLGSGSGFHCEDMWLYVLSSLSWRATRQRPSSSCGGRTCLPAECRSREHLLLLEERRLVFLRSLCLLERGALGRLHLVHCADESAEEGDGPLDCVAKRI